MSIFNIFKNKEELGEKKFKKRVEKREEKTEIKSVPPKVVKKIKKPTIEKSETKKKGKKAVEKKQEKPKQEKETKVVKPKKQVKSEIAWKVLERPHITEKASDLTKENEYVFRVFTSSNKIEVKKAVEDVYGVNVKKVRIINVPRKKRRLGKTHGWRKGYKKAIVIIQKGQEIEILPR